MFDFRFRIPNLAARRRASGVSGAALEGHVSTLNGHIILKPKTHEAMVTTLNGYTILKESE